MYVLDRQIQYYAATNRLRLGGWLKRRFLCCAERHREAERILHECEIDVETLRAEWQAQIKAQTMPLQRKLLRLCGIPRLIK